MDCCGHDGRRESMAFILMDLTTPVRRLEDSRILQGHSTLTLFLPTFQGCFRPLFHKRWNVAKYTKAALIGV
jgi:hypothetical protein